MVTARLLQGVGATIASPTGLALVATTFPKGPARNLATAVFGAMTAIGSVMGLVVGGALTEVSWRLAFLVNVPIGIVMLYLARTALRETNRERMKLDAAGAMLATLACTAAVFAFTQGPERLAVAHHAGLRCGGCRVRYRVSHRRAQRGEPGGAVRSVPRAQPRRDVRGHLPGRRRAVHADRADRPVRAGHPRLQRIARGCGLHPVRDRHGHRARCVVPDRAVLPAPPRRDRGRHPGSRIDDLRFDAAPGHPVLPQPRGADHHRRYRHRHDRGAADAGRDRGRRLRPHRPGLGHRAHAAEPGRSAGAGHHPGRHHLAHAVPGRHHRPGQGDEPRRSWPRSTRATPTACCGSRRLRSWSAVRRCSSATRPNRWHTRRKSRTRSMPESSKSTEP